jgi:23S rRNA pseudouridine1911/1915/1917 synthase
MTEIDILSAFGPEPPLIEATELRSWILLEDERLLVLNKPGWVVCHPSKNGPWSSLVGAAREYLGGGTVHLVSRLDRETSGLIVLAKDRGMARLLQMALQDRAVEKRYLAIVEGVWEERRELSKAIEDDPDTPVVVKQRVATGGGGTKAQTSFLPREAGPAHSLVEVIPHTGRKHQIRVHAQFAGHPIVGDKLYGPDPLLYLRFIESGWTAEHGARLEHFRQALHAWKLTFCTREGEWSFEAPEPNDFTQLWARLRASHPSEAGNPE